MAVLFAADLVVDGAVVVSAAYVGGPILAGLRSRPRDTLAVGALALACGAITGAVDGIVTDDQHVVRLAVIAVGSAAAALGSDLRLRATAAAARATFLARATEVLAAERDVEASLRAVVELAVPELADWAAIALERDGALEWVAMAAHDRARIPDVREYQRRWPARRDAPAGAGRVWGTGEPYLMHRIPEEFMASLAPGQRELMARLDLHSSLGVPLRIDGEVRGVLIMATDGTSRRRLDAADLELAEELARVYALGLTNAQLYTASREAERRLAESYALLDAIYARAPVGLALFDRDLRFIRINDRLAEINGIPVDAHLGRRVDELLPDMGAGVMESLRAVAAQGTAVEETEVTGRTPADPGRDRTWIASYWPVRTADGGVVGVGGVILDITERRAAERALEDQTALYEALLRALGEVGEGLLIVEDERIVYANDAFCAMSGRTRDQLLALPSLFELVDPDDAEEARRRTRLRVQRDLVDPQYELGLMRPDGSRLDVEVAAVPRRHDRRLQLVVVVRDISARRRAEASRERLAERTALLARASSVFDAPLDPDQVVERVARLVAEEVADTCVILLVAPSGRLLRAAAGARDPARQEAMDALQARFPLPLTEEHPMVQVLRSGRTQFHAEVPDHVLEAIAGSEEQRELMRALAVRGSVIVPMRARGRTVGVLSAGFERLPADQERELRAFFEDLASRAALALDTARLYIERDYVARTLQRSLLPDELPEIGGVDLGARYHAAGAGNEVGGDFYDVFATGRGDWAVVVGDVCGKGAEAAAITALARYTLRAAVLHDAAPASVLCELNEAIIRQGLEYRFCTALYVSLTPVAGGAVARVVSGGHPLPLVLRATGEVEEVGAPGTLLGVVDRPELPETEVRLAPGDALVAFTDGVVETRPGEGDFGAGELRAVLRRSAGANADDLAAAVEREVVEVQDGMLRDDLAVLVIRVPPGGGLPADRPG